MVRNIAPKVVAGKPGSTASAVGAGQFGTAFKQPVRSAFGPRLSITPRGLLSGSVVHDARGTDGRGPGGRLSSRGQGPSTSQQTSRHPVPRGRSRVPARLDSQRGLRSVGGHGLRGRSVGWPRPWPGPVPDAPVWREDAPVEPLGAGRPAPPDRAWPVLDAFGAHVMLAHRARMRRGSRSRCGEGVGCREQQRHHRHAGECKELQPGHTSPSPREMSTGTNLRPR